MAETKRIAWSKIVVGLALTALLVLCYLLPIVMPNKSHEFITRTPYLDFTKPMFLYVFLSTFLILYFVLKTRKLRNAVLYVYSLIFVSWGNPVYLILVLICTLFTYGYGRSINRDIKDGLEVYANMTMRFVIGLNILIIIAFGFFNSWVYGIRYLANHSFEFKSVAAPIGLIIYCLHSIAYIMDVYQGLGVSKISYIEVSLYMIMFPRLLVGPYEKPKTLISQIKSRSERIDLVGEGAKKFLIGYLKKVLIASNVVYLFNHILEFNRNDVSALTAWLGAILLVLGIYFALSGYSDMAVGLGKIIGFELKSNFNEPFSIMSIAELGNRFMISFYEFLREYFYYPISENRLNYSGIAVGPLAAMPLFMSLTFGYDGRFIIAGALLMLIVILEYVIKGPGADRKYSVLGYIYTKIVLILVAVLWASPNIGSAMYYFKAMFLLNGKIFDMTGLYYLKSYFFIILILVLLANPSIVRNIIKRIRRRRGRY